MPTGGAVKLTIDSNKYGWVEFPDGTMQVTVDGKINTTYTGATGEIKYFVPKNTSFVDIQNSSIQGSITYTGSNILYALLNSFLTSVSANKVTNQVDIGGCTSCVSLLASKATVVTASNCALTAKSIGDILFAAYVVNRKNVNFNFSGGTNAGTTAIGVYTLATYGITLGQLDNPLVADGGTILYNNI